MNTKALLAVGLTLAMTGAQACSLSERVGHWNGEGAQVNEAKDIPASKPACVSNDIACNTSRANRDNGRRTIRPTLFVWNAVSTTE